MQSHSCDRVRFDRFVLDPAGGTLLEGVERLNLRPKSFEVLCYLVRNAGRVVGKDELLAGVWPQVHVTEDSLTRCVSEVRTALGDTGQKIIETVPKRGYIFLAAVIPVGLGDAVLPLVEPAIDAGNVTPSIAVLRFEALSADAGQEYFGDGLAEDLITSLSRFSNLCVISRNSSFAYSARHSDTSQVGRELKVRYIVEGSVRREAARLRVTARVVDAERQNVIWAQSYDQPFHSVFEVQDDLTRNIVGTLISNVNRAKLARSKRQPTSSLAAYDYYLRGRSLLANRSGADRGRMVAEARGMFEKSLAADADYAPAVEGLAEAHNIIWLERSDDRATADEHRNPRTLLRALELADRAVLLNPYSANAYITRAYILHWLYRRDDAREDVKKGLEFNPNQSDGRIGHMMMQTGRTQQALDFFQNALRYDPFPPSIYLSWQGNSFYLLGRFEEAFRTLKRGSECMPTYPAMFVWLAAAAAMAEHMDDARHAAACVTMQQPAFTIRGWLDFIRLPERDGKLLAEGLHRAGLPP
jgi:adenylate cyclase